MPDDASDERLVGAKDGDYIYECTVSHRRPPTHTHTRTHTRTRTHTYAPR